MQNDKDRMLVRVTTDDFQDWIILRLYKHGENDHRFNLVTDLKYEEVSDAVYPPPSPIRLDMAIGQKLNSFGRRSSPCVNRQNSCARSSRRP